MSFVVFQDASLSQPSSSSTKATTSTRPSSSVRKAKKASSSVASLKSSLQQEEKENVNPLTGHRTTSNNTKGKKQKPGVHANNSKKAVSKTVDASSRPLEVKNEAGSFQLSTSSFSCEFSTFGVDGFAATTQALFNSLCYDLTVSPLADVSEAYNAEPVDVFGDYVVDEKPNDLLSGEDTLLDALLSCPSDVDTSSTLITPESTHPSDIKLSSDLGALKVPSAAPSGNKASKSKSAKKRL